MLLLSASVITSFFLAIVTANNETDTSRIGKQLGVFTVVQVKVVWIDCLLIFWNIPKTSIPSYVVPERRLPVRHLRPERDLLHQQRVLQQGSVRLKSAALFGKFSFLCTAHNDIWPDWQGGSSSGSCASSFGVCCVFEKSCGAGSISENCTYFSSSDFSAGSACSLTICKTASDVCNLRLDFETFVLSNPVSIFTA